jgi:hypothetical protein
MAAGGLPGLRPHAFVPASPGPDAVPDGGPAPVERSGAIRARGDILFGTGDRILGHRAHGGGMAERESGARVGEPRTTPEAVE